MSNVLDASHGQTSIPLTDDAGDSDENPCTGKRNARTQ